MRNLVILFVHVLATLARLWGPGGIRSVVAESVLVKQQLLILNRSRQRSPNLLTSDRLVAGLCALLIRPARLIRSAIVLRPSTLLSLHQALIPSCIHIDTNIHSFLRHLDGGSDATASIFTGRFGGTVSAGLAGSSEQGRIPTRAMR